MKPITPIHQFWKASQYTIRKTPLLTLLLAVAICLSLYIASSADLTQKYFTSFLDAFAGIVTLLVAAGIAVHNYLKDWMDSRPKTLTVHFTHNGKYYLSCYYADLTSKADIRMWSQQLGQQMTGGALLDFNPYFDLTPGKIVSLAPNNTIVLHYEINIILKSTKDARSKKELFNGFYQRWYVVHNNEHFPDERLVLKPITPTEKPPFLTYQEAVKVSINHPQINQANDTVPN